MPYRGLPYFVAEHAGTGGRVDPYASERHVMPDCAQGVRYSTTPHNSKRRVVSYRSCETVCPPRAHGATVEAAPSMADIEPMRILAAVMLMAVIAFAAAFIGIGVAHGFTDFVDGAVMTDTSGSVKTTTISTPQSSWERGTVPSLYQVDPQWADRPYGPSTLGAAGAAPMTLAMVRVDLTGDASMGPVEVASLAQRRGYADQPDATSLLTDGATEIGLTARPVEADELSVRRQINSGFPVVCAVKSDAFGDHTTYIVLTDIDEHGHLVICDPGSVERSEKHWSFDEVLTSSSALWAYSVSR